MFMPAGLSVVLFAESAARFHGVLAARPSKHRAPANPAGGPKPLVLVAIPSLAKFFRLLL